MWGESPIGTWTLEVRNDGRAVVELKGWSLVFHGTQSKPQEPQARTQEQQQPEKAEPEIKPESLPRSEPTTTTLLMADRNCELPANDGSGFCERCVHGFVRLETGFCAASCPQEGYYLIKGQGQESCGRCYYACKTCSGPDEFQCDDCYGDAELQVKGQQRFCYNKSLIAKVSKS